MLSKRHTRARKITCCIAFSILSLCHQVDVTAEDAAPAAGGLPAVDEQAVKAADPMASVLGLAQRQMGAGWTTHDPWRAISAGVAGIKPHKSQVRCCCGTRVFCVCRPSSGTGR